MRGALSTIIALLGLLLAAVSFYLTGDINNEMAAARIIDGDRLVVSIQNKGPRPAQNVTLVGRAIASVRLKHGDGSLCQSPNCMLSCEIRTTMSVASLGSGEVTDLWLQINSYDLRSRAAIDLVDFCVVRNGVLPFERFYTRGVLTRYPPPLLVGVRAGTEVGSWRQHGKMDGRSFLVTQSCERTPENAEISALWSNATRGHRITDCNSLQFERTTRR